MGAPRVVLMPAAGDREPVLGRELGARARRWAEAVAPGEVSMAANGLGASVDELFAAASGPVLVTWPELVRWRADHASGALEDLVRGGCDISLGPLFDGGFYLVAFARRVPALLELPDAAWQDSDPIGLAAGAALGSGFTIGLLRTERGLRRPGDVRALLADPLLDDDLRRLLG